MLLRDEIEPNKLHAVYKTQCVVECKLSTEQHGASPLRCPLVVLAASLSNCCSSRSVQELNRLLSSSHSLGVESVSAPSEGRYFLLCTQFSRVTRGPTDAEALVRTQRCETRLSFGKNRTPQPGVGSAFTFIMTYEPFSVLL